MIKWGHVKRYMCFLPRTNCYENKRQYFTGQTKQSTLVSHTHHTHTVTAHSGLTDASVLYANRHLLHLYGIPFLWLFFCRPRSHVLTFPSHAQQKNVAKNRLFLRQPSLATHNPEMTNVRTGMLLFANAHAQIVASYVLSKLLTRHDRVFSRCPGSSRPSRAMIRALTLTSRDRASL